MLHTNPPLKPHPSSSHASNQLLQAANFSGGVSQPASGHNPPRGRAREHASARSKLQVAYRAEVQQVAQLLVRADRGHALLLGIHLGPLLASPEEGGEHGETDRGSSERGCKHPEAQPGGDGAIAGANTSCLHRVIRCAINFALTKPRVMVIALEDYMY